MSSQMGGGDDNSMTYEAAEIEVFVVLEEIPLRVEAKIVLARQGRLLTLLTY